MEAWRRSLEQELAKSERVGPQQRAGVLLLRAELQISPCECLSPKANFSHFHERYLGADDRDGDLWIHTCRHCGRVWIRYFYEDHVHDTSGRWYRGLIDLGRAANLDANGARDLLEQLPWKLCGGSYFDGRFFVAFFGPGSP